MFIVIGILVFYWAVTRHEKFHQLNLASHFDTLLALGICAGIIGGRFLCIVSESYLRTNPYLWLDIFSGGFSVLGSIIAIISTAIIYCRLYAIPLLPFFDLIALFAPLLHAIARVGCFFAGCCYGITCIHSWATTYTNPDCLAPLGINLHPTQLYSAVLLLFLFIILNHRARTFYNPGTIIGMYLFGAGLERFIVEFWRADTIQVYGPISLQQAIAGLLIISGIVLLWYTNRRSFITNHART
jgi:phosphatidylglycerol:prolipoprotein diacylglycerol transferase